MVAPWHPAGFSKDWATIKWLAYGANMHSARLARRQGADDALLLARGHGVADDGPLGDRAVLDGPNFAVAWLEDKVIKMPCWRRLGMLESITARLLLDAAAAENFRVDEGVHRLSDLDRADEVYVLSTTNDLTPVRRVGYASFKRPVVAGAAGARPRDGGLRGARVASVCRLLLIIRGDGATRVATRSCARPRRAGSRSRPFSSIFLRHAVAATRVSRLALEPWMDSRRYLSTLAACVSSMQQSSASQFSCFSGRAEAVVLLW